MTDAILEYLSQRPSAQRLSEPQAATLRRIVDLFRQPPEPEVVRLLAEIVLDRTK